jgi:hypothetical protein
MNADENQKQATERTGFTEIATTLFAEVAT